MACSDRLRPKITRRLVFFKKISEIPGYENYTNYEMNQLGVLRNIETGRELKWTKDKDCYLHLNVYSNGIKKIILQHRAIACLFIPNPLNLPIVDHIVSPSKEEIKRGHVKDNSLSNLRWCTVQENNRNQGLSVRNTSGYKDICPMIHHGKPVWRIQDRDDDVKLKYAIFPRKTFEPPANVIAKRDAMLKEYHRGFANNGLQTAGVGSEQTQVDSSDTGVAVIFNSNSRKE